jgi:hypothetical protein
MSNFKSGSGNLDFGGSDDEDDEDDETATETTGTQDEEETQESTSTEQRTPTAPARDAMEESATSSPTAAEEYPYFVRRNNVGDERDTRLEIHVRDKVADQEANFRNELAKQLGVNEISKTDAREFALLAAFHHPERVAELMRDEGFGSLG